MSLPDIHTCTFDWHCDTVLCLNLRGYCLIGVAEHWDISRLLVSLSLVTPQSVETERLIKKSADVANTALRWMHDNVSLSLKVAWRLIVKILPWLLLGDTYNIWRLPQSADFKSVSVIFLSQSDSFWLITFEYRCRSHMFQSLISHLTLNGYLMILIDIWCIFQSLNIDERLSIAHSMLSYWSSTCAFDHFMIIALCIPDENAVIDSVKCMYVKSWYGPRN